MEERRISPTIEQTVETTEPPKIKLGEWLSPFKESKVLPSFKNQDVEIPFTLEGYGPGTISVHEWHDFLMEGYGKKERFLVTAGNKPITITLDVRTGNHGNYWNSTGKRAPMLLTVNLKDIPKHLVYKAKDRYEHPFNTTGLRCYLEVPVALGNEIFSSSTYVSGLTIGYQTERKQQMFGIFWREEKLTKEENVEIYFADDQPNLFKAVRVKFKKTFRQKGGGEK